MDSPASLRAVRTLLLLAVALVGCGPDVSKVVATCSEGGLTVESEREIACTWVEHDVRLARRSFAAAGLLEQDAFAARFANTRVIYRDMEALHEGERPGTGVIGYHHPWGIELANTGGALFHELVHIYGIEHGGAWPVAAEEDYDTYSLDWRAR